MKIQFREYLVLKRVIGRSDNMSKGAKTVMGKPTGTVDVS